MSNVVVDQHHTFCEVCKAHVPNVGLEAHLSGKKHKTLKEHAGIKKTIEETGLYLRGLPPNVDAAELSAVFGRYGYIAKIEIYGHRAFLNYSLKSSCDNALRERHYIRNKPLHVEKRRLKDCPGNNQALSVSQKRGFDNTPKNSPKAQNSPKKDKSQKKKESAIEPNAVYRALSQPSSLSEQMTTLKNFILMGPEKCKNICNQICSDMMSTMNASFSTCELYTFGSMTTGLAFKDSDLDVYGHLVLNTKTHMCGENQQNPKKIFAVAKSSFYRKPALFKDIVPIQGAKIPLVKFVHIPTKVACDLNFRDAIGHYNSNLLRHYLDMNERFFDLIVLLKYWARVHDFCSSSKLSSFSLCMLGLSFLLSLKNEDGQRIIPTVDELLNAAQSSDSDIYINKWKCSFNNTPIKVTLPDTPNYSLLGLVKGLFEYIASVPFETDVLSVSTGGLIPRELFSRPDELPDAYVCYKNFISEKPDEFLVKAEHFAVIHDPFRLNHNLLGRVNLGTMKNFVQACKKAAEDCAVSMNNKDVEATLLHHLLNTRKKFYEEVKSSLTKDKGNKDAPTSSKKDKSSSDAQTSMMLDNPFIANANPFEDLTDLIVMIFEKILLFDVSKSKEEPKSETECKVSKVDAMRDVHENTPTHSVIITCEGKKDVMNGRKKVKQLKHLSAPLSFEDEVMVSEVLQQNKEEYPLSFQCILTNDNGKYNLLFKAQQTCRNFKIFWSLIHTALPKWLVGLKQALVKPPATLENAVVRD